MKPIDTSTLGPIRIDSRQADVDADLLETMETWAFNVALECSVCSEPLEIALGGAVLDLHDLKRILDTIAALRADNARLRGALG